MTKEECYLLGNVARLHGFKGEVMIYLDVTEPLEYSELESVFVDIHGQLTPFFIESIQIQNKNFARVRFEGVTTEEEAKEILKKELYLPLSFLPELEGTSFYDHEVIGFDAVETHFGQVGKVIAILDHAANPLIQIDAKGTEVLIPLSVDTVSKVDRSNKALHFTAPEGLIELYLSGEEAEDKDQ
ncbi:ribosome maturation factor RimM [Wandonia haliotis]|uniref:Ribosome maturation factor RimM n=1 Tax=Wandonia haliotis TaxID=574963 RepID=A0ABN1MPQ3_9FLAO